MTDRCIDGRLMRHKPFPDDPEFEHDVGECAECKGAGCDGLTVFVCSNRFCGAVFNADPQGHCPVCANYTKPEGGEWQKDGGWSTMRRRILDLDEATAQAIKSAVALPLAAGSAT